MNGFTVSPSFIVTFGTAWIAYPGTDWDFFTALSQKRKDKNPYHKVPKIFSVDESVDMPRK